MFADEIHGAFYDFANPGLITQRLGYSRVSLFRSLGMFLLPICNSGKVYLPICKEMTNRERKRSSPRPLASLSEALQRELQEEE